MNHHWQKVWPLIQYFVVGWNLLSINLYHLWLLQWGIYNKFTKGKGLYAKYFIFVWPRLSYKQCLGCSVIFQKNSKNFKPWDNSSCAMTRKNRIWIIGLEKVVEYINIRTFNQWLQKKNVIHIVTISWKLVYWPSYFLAGIEANFCLSISINM